MRGRLVIGDRFECEGRCYVLVRSAIVERPDPRALTRQEACIVEMAALGLSHKVIAYERKLSRSRVTKILSSALSKLRLNSQAQLVWLLAVISPREPTRATAADSLAYRSADRSR